MTTRVCFSWLGRNSGAPEGCKFGNKCRFLHSKNEICERWKKNNCPNAPNACQYLHTYNPGCVSFEDGPLCKQVYNGNKVTVDVSNDVTPLCSSNESSPAKSAKSQVTEVTEDLATIKEQIDVEIQKAEAKQMIQVRAKEIRELAQNKVDQIREVQLTLYGMQNELDALKVEYDDLRKTNDSLPFDPSRYLSLLRLKASYEENLKSRTKQCDTNALAARLGVSVQHIEVLLTYMTMDEVLSKFGNKASGNESKKVFEPQDQASDEGSAKDDTCVICMENVKTYAVSCGHFSYCEKCVYSIDKCCICGTVIQGRHRIYS